MKMKNSLPFLILPLLLLLGSCVPCPPDYDTISKKWIYGGKNGNKMGIEVLTVNNFHNTRVKGMRRPNRRKVYKTVIPKRNMVLIALDDTVWVNFKDRIKEAYDTEKDIRFEDISYWQMAKQFITLYDHVIRVPHDAVYKESIFKAIEIAESYNKPYDLFLMVHGIPNHITTTKGHPLFSYKDVKELGEKISNLNLVFQQNCFGNTLIKDWKEAGAKYVISYSGWNRNFFYVDFFLRNLKKLKGNVSKAFNETNETIDEQMSDSTLYHEIFDAMEMDMTEYLEETPKPTLDK